MKKRIESLLLMAGIIMLLIPAMSAFADNNTFEYSDITYMIIDDAKKEVSVISSNVTYSGDVSIPSTVKNGSETYTVVAIGDRAFEGQTSLNTITLPDYIREIGKGAFQNCTNLTEINNSVNLAKIGGGAFADCTSLVDITIYNQLTTIGDYAFEGCKELKAIHFNNNSTCKLSYIGTGAFRSCIKLEKIDLTAADKLTTINKIAFDNCANLNKVILPDNLTTIGPYAFKYCENLKEITIPKSVKVIDEGAFNRCLRLEVVDFSNAYNLVTIGQDAFSYCEHLKKVDLTGARELTTISQSAFSHCVNVTEAIISDSVTKIGNSAFRECRNLKTLNILGNNLVIIDSDAFSYCYNLTGHIYIPDSVTRIGGSAFRNCESIESVYINADSIEFQAFYGCSGLKKIEFAESSKIKTIMASAFLYCSSLENVIIPDSVTILGAGAFEACDSLIYICYPARLHSDSNGDDSFSPNTLRALYTLDEKGAVINKIFLGDNVTKIVLPTTICGKKVYKIEGVILGGNYVGDVGLVGDNDGNEDIVINIDDLNKEAASDTTEDMTTVGQSGKTDTANMGSSSIKTGDYTETAILGFGALLAVVSGLFIFTRKKKQYKK